MQVASRKYVRLDELHDAVGKRIAELLHCEAALVTAGCASALSLATAACVAGADRDRIRRLPDTDRHEERSPRPADAPRRLRPRHPQRRREADRGRDPRGAGEGDQRADGDDVLPQLRPTRRGKIHHEEFVAIGKKHNVPTLIDAAADVPPVENLWRFTKMGFDLVAFSGGKGLRGPQSSGLLLGRKDLIAAARLNNSPNADSLCRTNKVNKEEIVGMLVALELVPEAGPRRGLEGVGRTLPPHLAGPRRRSRTSRTEVYVPADRQRRAAPAGELGLPGARA